MTQPRWPDRWQPEAIGALAPFVDSDHLIDLLVGPIDSLGGSRYAGYVYLNEHDELRIIHDHSGRPDVYPWELPIGPVLRISTRLPKRRGRVIYAHPTWSQIST